MVKYVSHCIESNHIQAPMYEISHVYIWENYCENLQIKLNGVCEQESQKAYGTADMMTEICDWWVLATRPHNYYIFFVIIVTYYLPFIKNICLTNGSNRYIICIC